MRSLARPPTYDAKDNTLTVITLATTANAETTTMTYELTYNQVATVTDPLSHIIMFKRNRDRPCNRTF